MHDSRLIAYFNSLARKEVLEFGRYLKTPFFNRDTHIISLYEYIRRYHPDLDSPKLEKKITYKKLFPKEAYQARKINDVMSDLSKKLESYMVYSEMKTDELEQAKLLVKAMKRRKLHDDFIRTTKDTLVYLEKRTERNMDYYYNKLRLKHAVTFHPAARQPKKKSGKDNRVDPLFEDLDKFYVLTKLRYYYEFLTWKGQPTIENDTVTLIPESMKMTFSDSFKENPLFEIYRLSISHFQDPSDEHYQILKNLILENTDLGNEEEKMAFMDLLINYIAQSINKGKQEYVRELFEVYKFRIKNNMLMEGGFFQETHFLNIVNVGCTLGEYDFVSDLIRDHEKHLKYPDSAIPLSKAKLSFAAKEYKKALKVIMQVSANDYKHEPVLRVLAIQCNYELGDSETTARLCDSYYSYLNRNKELTPATKKGNERFIYFVRQIMKIREERLSKEELIEALYNSPDIVAKAWLEKVINRLKN